MSNDPNRQREYDRRYKEKHPEKIRERNVRYYQRHVKEEAERRREYRIAHIEKEKKRERLYREKHPGHSANKSNVFREKNPGYFKQKMREYYRANPEKYRAMRRMRRDRHPEEIILRGVVRSMLKHNSIRKLTLSKSYVGCSSGFLRNHLESLFLPGMTWENWGEWHVDHIVPLSWFPVKEDPSLLFVASHWTNLQPLWGKANMQKGNRFIRREET